MFEQVLPMAFAAVTAVATWLAADRIRTRAAQRVRDLEQCRDLLARHTACLQTILASPDAPDEVKRLAIDMSDRFESRQFVAAFAPRFTAILRDRAAPMSSSAEAPDVDAQITALAAPLQHALAEAIVTGALAAMLRWPDLAGTALSASPTALLASGLSMRLPWIIATSSGRRNHRHDDAQVPPSHAIA